MAPVTAAPDLSLRHPTKQRNHHPFKHGHSHDVNLPSNPNSPAPAPRPVSQRDTAYQPRAPLWVQSTVPGSPNAPIKSAATQSQRHCVPKPTQPTDPSGAGSRATGNLRTIHPESASRRPWTAEACCRFPGASPLARHRPSSLPLGPRPVSQRDTVYQPRASLWVHNHPTPPAFCRNALYQPRASLWVQGTDQPHPPSLSYPSYPPDPPDPPDPPRPPQPRPLNPCHRPKRRINLSPSTPSMLIGTRLSRLSPNVKLRNRPSPYPAKVR